MKLRTILLFALSGAGAAVLAGCSLPSQEVKPVDIAATRQHLEAIADARILLGHQSVGRDVLAGVRSLAEQAGVPLRVQEIDGVPPDSGPGLFHSHIGKNGDPEGKCEVFGQLLNRPERPAYDLAMMKFCYADLRRDTPMEASAMLERYTRLVQDLGAQRPDVRIVHISLPLRAQPQGWKDSIKRMIGREIPADRDNALRNAFNDGLRERFSAEPFFDLAALQSTRADGSRSSIELDGQTVYTLAPEYTHDGGHLNPDAQRLAAAEFLRTLAAWLPDRAEGEAGAEQPVAEESATAL